ncbi:MAG: type II toxin-antitoxin system HicA family toxin [Syntrophomonadaceae bacterium]|jgi:predicted RNA binding protein YcfA (HicA-like mRNA interferase family)
MPSLPVISGQQAIKAFAKNGWVFVSQKGSHMKLAKDGFRPD